MLEFYLSLIDNEEEQSKLDTIYRKYKPLMRYLAAKIANNPSDINDIVHESIMKLIPHLHQIDLTDELSSKRYLSAIVESVVRDTNAKATRTANIEAKVAKSELDNSKIESRDVAEIILSDEGYLELLQFIKELDAKYREVCELKFVVGLKEREIAELLGIPVTTVGVRIHRARKLLQKRLLEGKEVEHE